MVNTSHLGSPLTAYAFIFPMAYYVNPLLGVLTILCTSFSEWLSGILKWVLHGHRPYWWVGLHAERTKTDILELEQFPSTCETGPGSPSGHCMITLAGMVPLVLYLQLCLPNQSTSRCFRFYREMMLSSFGCFILALGLSRCYLAAHFPHQVTSGILSGLLLGYLFTHLSGVLHLASAPHRSTTLTRTGLAWLEHWLKHPAALAWIGFGSLGVAWLFSWCLQALLGVDVNWSIALAKVACRRPEWVHMSTSLMVGFARIAGYMSGLALALYFNPPSDQALLSSHTKSTTLLWAVLAVVGTKLAESICYWTIHTLLVPWFPGGSATGPGVILLFSSVVQAGVGPIITAWLLPSTLRTVCAS
ncbi:Glucose-6-phosphatase [Paragonimus heterotremus]|uniref:glucose-6-phosphatase n=1 Tax=Paragonimus heterotremus TaxID=100268 RepID=A0A8J4WGQ1_9TREM|nr:Glucose-6-phosphatase [Paragonimus heterotremus]